MKVHFYLTILIFALFSCQSDQKEMDAEKWKQRRFYPSKNRSYLPISNQIEDQPVNDYLTATLAPIRTNFKHINSIENWSKITEHNLKESTEGGVAYFFYTEGKKEKIIERHFGETGQVLREYYLMDGELSFVFEKNLRYNRPIYWDEKHQKENKDSEIFDIEKSEVSEKRSYFKEGKLIHQIVSEDCGSPFTESYLREEEKRILDTYNDLLNLEK